MKSKCYLCTELCLPKDKKHPSRWKPWKALKEGIELTTSLLEICKQRKDEWLKSVSFCLYTITGFLAHKYRDHVHCYNSFRKVLSRSTVIDDKPVSNSLACVMEMTKSESDAITWTRFELHAQYIGKWETLSQKQFKTKLCKVFGDKLVVYKIPGC